jgi:hypothetical protein
LRVKNTPAKLADDTKSCLKSIRKWEDGQRGKKAKELVTMGP